MASLVMSQDFLWHDASGGCEYRFGEDGFLKMDGSTGWIACERKLHAPIAGPADALELHLRVTLGREYEIRMLGGDGPPMLAMRIGRDGAVLFQGDAGLVDTGLGLTHWRGMAYREPGMRPWDHAVQSDVHALRLGGFDFAHHTVTCQLDDLPAVKVEGCLRSPLGPADRLAFASPAVEPGTMIQVRAVRQYHGGALIHEETFPNHFYCVPAPPDGYADDNVTTPAVRPVDFHWLQTAQEYSYVQVKLPRPVMHGAIEFELMAPEVVGEHTIILEEWEGGIKSSGRLQVGFIHEMMHYAFGGEFNRTWQRYGPSPVFANIPDPEPNRPYHWRLEWDREAGLGRMWIDGEGIVCRDGGGADIPLAMFDGVARYPLPHRGIDAFSFHCVHESYMAPDRTTPLHKSLAARLSPPRVPVLTYWAGLRVEDLA